MHNLIANRSSDTAAFDTAAKLVVLDIPVIKLPDFTGGAAGAIELSVALDTIYSKAWAYVGAGTLKHDYDEDLEIYIDNPAGLYWLEMTSTTEGIIYSDTYTPGVGVLATPPTNPTLFANAIPGGAGEAIEFSMVASSYAAGALSVGTVLDIYGIVSCSDTATLNIYNDDGVLMTYPVSTPSSCLDVVSLVVLYDNHIRAMIPSFNIAAENLINTTDASEIWVTLECAAAEYAVLASFKFGVRK